MQQHIFNTMRSLKMIDGCKGAHVYDLNPSTSGTGGVGEKFLQHLQDHLRVNTIRSKSHRRNRSLSQAPNVNSSSLSEVLTIYGHPRTDLIEPQIDPCLRFVDCVDVLADIYRRLDNCSELERSDLYMEQCAIFRGLSDPKLSRRCLRLARKYAVDVHSKLVLSSWLRSERREDELLGVSAMDCSGWNIECPKSSLIPGYNPESADDLCACSRNPVNDDEIEECCSSSVDDGEDFDMCFCIGDDEIRCNRFRMASLSIPFKSLLYGSFMESRRESIYFSQNGISPEAMRAAVIFSVTKKVTSFDPNIVFELLTLANRFCCDEMKSACDSHLSSLVDGIETALLFIEYALEETAHLLVAACLQVFLREMPHSLRNPNVMKIFCSSEARSRLASSGHASFHLYAFLSQVAMEEDTTSNTTVMLLERMAECASSQSWQKQLSFHLLGCVMLERKEYKDSQAWFELASREGHAYSLVGAARATEKCGHKYNAYKLMNSMISDCREPCGWMYQERSLYNNGKEKMMDLKTATDLNPTLSYPYKYRAVSLMEEETVDAAISEINRIIHFKVSPDCLELRAWFSILSEDYEGAMMDIRALMTLDPDYMMFHGMLHGDRLVELLNCHVQQRSLADCWMQLYDRWSSVDDIGSLAVVHHMLANDPGKSLLRFRQSLLLLRLNCQKAAMRSLRMARNHASSEHEKLVYEGWILYDTGYREQAIAKAEESISLQRSFEAFFLKAYVLSETTVDHKSSFYVIELLEEALRCPSDGLRKGQ
ncbi:ethylene-overproduction protein 1, partial [Genlisea aurea]